MSRCGYKNPCRLLLMKIIEDDVFIECAYLLKRWPEITMVL